MSSLIRIASHKDSYIGRRKGIDHNDIGFQKLVELTGASMR